MVTMEVLVIKPEIPSYRLRWKGKAGTGRTERGFLHITTTRMSARLRASDLGCHTPEIGCFGDFGTIYVLEPIRVLLFKLLPTWAQARGSGALSLHVESPLPRSATGRYPQFVDLAAYGRSSNLQLAKYTSSCSTSLSASILTRSRHMPSGSFIILILGVMFRAMDGQVLILRSRSLCKAPAFGRHLLRLIH